MMTTKVVSCPICNQTVDSQTNTCENCGVNLALAAVLAERELSISPGSIPEMNLSPEVLVPRLGDYLIERNYLSPDELLQALAYQRQMQESGQTKLIGQALLELDLISREVLDQAITEQILTLQSALHQANEELENRVRERTAELEQALSRLAELNQLKSNFISNVSHELRTPLTHLKGYLELLGEEALGDITPQQADAIRVMSKAESRLGNLIEDLIQFSAYSRGNLEIQIEAVDLPEVLQGVMDKARFQCSEKGLEFQSKIPPDLPRVQADCQKLPWVMQHLIDNAVKFTAAGGLVQVGAIVENSCVKLYVYDTGIGIPASRLTEIFEPFHQLDSSSTRRYGGTGLGLSMGRQIVEDHGSEITVRSKEGEGSYFEFALSLADGT